MSHAFQDVQGLQRTVRDQEPGVRLGALHVQSVQQDLRARSSRESEGSRPVPRVLESDRRLAGHRQILPRSSLSCAQKEVRRLWQDVASEKLDRLPGPIPMRPLLFNGSEKVQARRSQKSEAATPMHSLRMSNRRYSSVGQVLQGSLICRPMVDGMEESRR